MSNKLYKCPECPVYLASDPEYYCTLCCGSGVATLEDALQCGFDIDEMEPLCLLKVKFDQ